MSETDQAFEVKNLGACKIPSPMTGVRFVRDEERVLFHGRLSEIKGFMDRGAAPPAFELAGPREQIYFDPSKLKCGIVTCGGLCPGLNDVIRAIVLSLFHHYGVQTVFGFRYGYQGLCAQHGDAPLELTPNVVRNIHNRGGTILGSSRGAQDIPFMVDTLERMNIGMLFAVGGDGTLRGAHAIHEEIARRNLKISVIGLPKTIDNDISHVDQSFGFATAVSESGSAIYSAHAEALGARNGVGLVKLMGRHSGFIPAYAALALGDVNFCLIPEIPFSLDTLLGALKQRLEQRGHAVIVMGEGAGQDLLEATNKEDDSGNVRFADVGVFLRDRIKEYFDDIGMEMSIKYIDPSYAIRSMPANPRDSAFCLLLGHNAVHAGMAGRTDLVVGHWGRDFTHVPIPLAVSERKQIDPESRLWNDVLACTGQPKDLS